MQAGWVRRREKAFIPINAKRKSQDLCDIWKALFLPTVEEALVLHLRIEEYRASEAECESLQEEASETERADNDWLRPIKEHDGRR